MEDESINTDHNEANGMANLLTIISLNFPSLVIAVIKTLTCDYSNAN